MQYLAGFGTVIQATFGSDDASDFALTELVWGVSTSSWTSKPMTFVGYKNGLPVPGATLNATTPSGTGITNTTTVTFTSNIAFNDVDNIVLAPNSSTCNTILFLETIVISTPTPACYSPTLTVTSSSNVLCNGQSNGSATITATGGSGFTYTWSPSGGNAASATGLSAGIYTLSANNSSCSIISTKTVQITQPSALSTSTAVTNAACNGSTGSASITASGGTGAYTYSWSSGATTSVISSALAGAYTATVTDANSCKSVKGAVITQPSALITSTAVTNVACNGGTGSASVTASGGAGAYTYSWSTGATSSFISSALAGAYTATVTDANNCKSVKGAVITQPSALITTTAVTNVACNGGAGSASITASGGAGAYTYSWSTGATSSFISSALAGAYTATVTDANSCASVKASIITQPSALITSTGVTNAACNGGTGSATISTTGGTGAYTYSWSSGATSSAISSALAGVYTATVTDANSCTSINSVIITQPSALITSTAITNAACNGGTGSASITASGGTGAYTYSWSTGATSSVISSPLAGAYSATVTDANNCTSVKGVIITQPSALITSTTITNVACNGGTGSATIAASGGTGAYTYSWSTGATTSFISTVLAGAYSATVTDANSCTSLKSAVITQPSALITSTTLANPACNGSTGSATISASGGTGAYTYSWSSAATSSVISGLTSGIYTGTVTDANNCQSIKSVSITVPSAITLTGTVNSASICSGNTYTLTGNASGGTGVITYTWVSGPANSIFVVTPTISTIYTVNVSDANACSRSPNCKYCCSLWTNYFS